jgi:hypothetical protein
MIDLGLEYKIIWLVFIAIIFAICLAIFKNDAKPITNQLIINEDKEHGIICYSFLNYSGISCIKVREENPSCNAFK